MKHWYLLFLVGLIASCSSDSGDNYDSVAGTYSLSKVLTDEAVDFNADDLFETDITTAVSCSSNLTITSNGHVNWIGMDLDYTSYSMELMTGNIVDYGHGTCATGGQNYSGVITQDTPDHILFRNDFDEIVELKKNENKLELQDTESLIVMRDGILRLETVMVTYVYQKN